MHWQIYGYNVDLRLPISEARGAEPPDRSGAGRPRYVSRLTSSKFRQATSLREWCGDEAAHRLRISRLCSFR
jgi:hypothetical protein